MLSEAGAGLPFLVWIRRGQHVQANPLRRWVAAPATPSVEDVELYEYDRIAFIVQRPEGALPCVLSIEGTDFHLELGAEQAVMERPAWDWLDHGSALYRGLWGWAGIHTLRITSGHTDYRTLLEVRPSRVTFRQMEAMCADIERISNWISYDLLPYAPRTHHAYEPLRGADRPDADPALGFQLLRESVPAALRAVRAIANAPHAAVTADYQHGRPHRPGRRDARCQTLERRLPEHLEDSLRRCSTLTHETYENRFVALFLLTLQRHLQSLRRSMEIAIESLEDRIGVMEGRWMDYVGVPLEPGTAQEGWTAELQGRLGAIRAHAAEARRMENTVLAMQQLDFLRDVHPLQEPVHAVGILRKDPNYRKLFQSYSRLLTAPVKVRSRRHALAMPSRPTWELYEMWCVAQVVEVCTRELDFIKVSDDGFFRKESERSLSYFYDPPYGARMELYREKDRLSLEIVYAGFLPFKPPGAVLPRGTLYSSDLHTSPDIQIRAWLGDETDHIACIILDAKYRSGRRLWQPEGDAITEERAQLESYYHNIYQASGMPRRTYRPDPDVPVVDRAFALYPGERTGQDLPRGERRTPDGAVGVIRAIPGDPHQEELVDLLSSALERIVGWLSGAHPRPSRLPRYRPIELEAIEDSLDSSLRHSVPTLAVDSDLYDVPEPGGEAENEAETQAPEEE